MVKAKKWVLVGDDKQLLPIFRGKLIKNNLLFRKELSTFCQFRKKYEDTINPDLNRALPLVWHYRCHPKIISFAKEHVYKGSINIYPGMNEKEKELNLTDQPFLEFLRPKYPAVFVDVTGTECRESVRSGSRYNEAEIEIVELIVMELKSLGIRSCDIGIITPYRAQRDRIKKILKDKEIEIHTLDSFQGKEADVIVFSITSTDDMKFVEDKNKVNVALTRAIKKLAVIGNGKSVVGAGLLSEYANYCKKNKSYFPSPDKNEVERIKTQIDARFQKNKKTDEQKEILVPLSPDEKKILAIFTKDPNTSNKQVKKSFPLIGKKKINEIRNLAISIRKGSIQPFTPKLRVTLEELITKREKCFECRHFEESEKWCLIRRKKVNPKYSKKCLDFGRKGI